jgi:phosphatidylglycerol:prolipoprotein diacylglycerol transferase
LYPRLLTTPLFTLHTFGVLLAAAYLSSLWWLTRGARREGLDHDAFMSIGMWAIGGAIIGAKLLMVVRSLPEYIANPSLFWSISLLTSAGDFYGGFIGGVLGFVLYFWFHSGFSFWRAADLCGPAIALGQAIGRIGCLMAGDDYGRPTSVPWAVVFTDPEAGRIGGAPLGVPLHPVQLYESLVCLALFLFLVWLGKRKRWDGQIFLAYTLLYAVNRFWLEYFRGDADRGFVFGGALSTSQFIGIVAFAVSSILWLARRRSPPARSIASRSNANARHEDKMSRSQVRPRRPVKE